MRTGELMIVGAEEIRTGDPVYLDAVDGRVRIINRKEAAQRLKNAKIDDCDRLEADASVIGLVKP